MDKGKSNLDLKDKGSEIRGKSVWEWGAGTAYTIPLRQERVGPVRRPEFDLLIGCGG